MNFKLMNNRFVAFVGFILMLPAIILIVAALSHKWFGFVGLFHFVDFRLFFFHPSIMMGGLTFAFLVNTLSIVRVSAKKGVFLRLRRHVSLLNVWIILFSIALTGIISAFLLAKNLQLFSRLIG